MLQQNHTLYCKAGPAFFFILISTGQAGMILTASSQVGANGRGVVRLSARGLNKAWYSPIHRKSLSGVDQSASLWSAERYMSLRGFWSKSSSIRRQLLWPWGYRSWRSLREGVTSTLDGFFPILWRGRLQHRGRSLAHRHEEAMTLLDLYQDLPEWHKVHARLQHYPFVQTSESQMKPTSRSQHLFLLKAQQIASQQRDFSLGRITEQPERQIKLGSIKQKAMSRREKDILTFTCESDHVQRSQVCLFFSGMSEYFYTLRRKKRWHSLFRGNGKEKAKQNKWGHETWCDLHLNTF